MPETLEPPTRASADIARIAACVDCGASFDGMEECPGCGRHLVLVDGIVDALGPLEGNNRIAAAFYESAAWSKFRFWEDVFLFFQGPGVARARRQVLRHLGLKPGARVLEVGIGDGENVPLIPSTVELFGVDIARKRLDACLRRFAGMRGRLALAEAEKLPFENCCFDAVFTVGGINYFNDPARALREMKRVTRRGGMVVAADELPDLFRLNVGHCLGLESLDRGLLRLSGIAPDFIAMVYHTPPAVEAVARVVWPEHRRVPIWNRLGYCLVDVRQD